MTLGGRQEGRKFQRWWWSGKYGCSFTLDDGDDGKIRKKIREESQETAAQQKVSRVQHTENIKEAMRGEMEAMEARMNTRKNEY